MLGSARSLKILCVEAHVPNKKWRHNTTCSRLERERPTDCARQRWNFAAVLRKELLARSHSLSVREALRSDDTEEREADIKWYQGVLVRTWRFEEHVVLT